MPIRLVHFDIEPNHAWPISVPATGLLEVNLDQVAAAGMKEIIQARLSSAHVGGLLGDLLAPARPGENQPPALRWRGRGIGAGIEMKRAFSGVFGRFFARWYLKTHHGYRFFWPIDNAPDRVSERLVLHRTGNQFLPDWVCAKAGSLCFAESKGSHAQHINAARTAAPLQAAEHQLQSAQMWVRNPVTYRYEQRGVKGWGVMSRWATQEGNIAPLLYVIDPWSKGEPLQNAEMVSLAREVELAHYSSLLTGMGLASLARRVQPLSEPDANYKEIFGSPSPDEPLSSTTQSAATVRLGIERVSEKKLLSVIVDAQGQIITDPTRNILESRKQIPPGLAANLFVVGFDIEILEGLLRGERVQASEAFTESYSQGNSRLPFISVQEDGFVIAPIDAVMEIEEPKSELLSPE